MGTGSLLIIFSLQRLKAVWKCSWYELPFKVNALRGSWRQIDFSHVEIPNQHHFFVIFHFIWVNLELFSHSNLDQNNARLTAYNFHNTESPNWSIHFGILTWSSTLEITSIKARQYFSLYRVHARIQERQPNVAPREIEGNSHAQTNILASEKVNSVLWVQKRNQDRCSTDTTGLICETLALAMLVPWWRPCWNDEIMWPRPVDNIVGSEGFWDIWFSPPCVSWKVTFRLTQCTVTLLWMNI